MAGVLDKNVFFVKEHVGLLKAANNFDILDPETSEVIMECREEKLGFLTKILRFTEYKRMTPFDIQVRTPDGSQVVRVKRGIALFLSKVCVMDESDNEIGGFKQNCFLLVARLMCSTRMERNCVDSKERSQDGIFAFSAPMTRNWLM